MLTREENELLCRVEGDAPMGQLMRRHWTPVCLVEEVAEPVTPAPESPAENTATPPAASPQSTRDSAAAGPASFQGDLALVVRHSPYFGCQASNKVPYESEFPGWLSALNFSRIEIVFSSIS